MWNRSLFLIRPTIRNSGKNVKAAFYNQKHIKHHQCAIIPFSLLLILLSPLNGSSQSDRRIKPLEQAASLIRANRINEAEQQLINILKAAPNEPQALNLLGTVRASQSRLTEAETLFARAIRIDPRMVGAHLNLAYLYLLKGAPDKTISQLKEVLSLDPNHSEALHKLARLLLLQGRPDECINLIEKSTQPLPVTLLVMRGEAYLKKGDADKAEESFRAALEKQSIAPDALLGLAQVSQLRGDAKASADYLYRVRQMSAASPDLLYKLGVAALKSGAYDEANSSFEQAIRIKPDDAAYHIALGATRLKKPDLFEAERAFRRALQLQPDSSQGQMYLGYSLLKQKKYTEARMYLEKSIKTDRSIPEPFYYLSLIAQGQNEEKRAVEILEDVVKRFPNFVNARIALGSSYMKLKNYPRATQELELAVKLNPDEPRAHYNLAILYARLKNPQRAEQEMQIVERLKNGNKQAKENDAILPSPPNLR
jgi:Flp pilus assembly protein TadD